MKKVAVIGAGMMGREIAINFAKAGHQVMLSDISMEAVLKAKEGQEKLLNKDVEKGRMSAEEKEAVLERIIPCDDLCALGDVDIVTECVSENFELKERIYKQLDSVCKESCIFLTNTSTISVTKLSVAVSPERKRRFLGTHYFSPATVMKLVEVIPGLLCEEAITEEVHGLMTSIGKTPVLVKDVPGFVVNRIYEAIMLEACKLLEEGVASVEDIDTACKLGMGHPVGPFELYDNTSLALNLAVQGELFDAYGERFRPNPLLVKKVSAGQNGRNAGEGFYVWENSRKVGVSKSV